LFDEKRKRRSQRGGVGAVQVGLHHYLSSPVSSCPFHHVWKLRDDLEVEVVEE
jgi:hypothetical protein